MVASDEVNLEKHCVHINIAYTQTHIYTHDCMA